MAEGHDEDVDGAKELNDLDGEEGRLVLLEEARAFAGRVATGMDGLMGMRWMTAFGDIIWGDGTGFAGNGRFACLGSRPGGEGDLLVAAAAVAAVCVGLCARRVRRRQTR